MKFPLVTLLAALLTASAVAQQSAIDTTTMVVIGDGIAAGMTDFALREVAQKQAFPSLVAKQIGTPLPLPLIEAPGLGSVPGFPAMPVRAPGPFQTTVRSQFPPPVFVLNLSVPGAKVNDVTGRRPGWPLIQPNDMQQTLTNFILGYPALILNNDKPLWTALEYAQQMQPTFVVISLGYADVLDAAATGDTTKLPDVTAFTAGMTSVISKMKATQSNVIVLNVPDPLDSAYYTTLSGATAFTGASAAQMQSLFSLRADDLLTVNGLLAASSLILQNRGGVLPAGSVVPASSAAAISASVRALNAAIANIVQQQGVLSYDLNTLIHGLKVNGLTVGNNVYTADFNGGLYTMSGFYPGTTIQALIANGILGQLNSKFSKSYALIDIPSTAGSDPAVRLVSPRAITDGQNDGGRY
jgi:hypothetical protein